MNARPVVVVPSGVSSGIIFEEAFVSHGNSGIAQCWEVAEVWLTQCQVVRKTQLQK